MVFIHEVEPGSPSKMNVQTDARMNDGPDPCQMPVSRRRSKLTGVNCRRNTFQGPSTSAKPVRKRAEYAVPMLMRDIVSLLGKKRMKITDKSTNAHARKV